MMLLVAAYPRLHLVFPFLSLGEYLPKASFGICLIVHIGALHNIYVPNHHAHVRVFCLKFSLIGLSHCKHVICDMVAYSG